MGAPLEVPLVPGSAGSASFLVFGATSRRHVNERPRGPEGTSGYPAVNRKERSYVDLEPIKWETTYKNQDRARKTTRAEKKFEFG